MVKCLLLEEDMVLQSVGACFMYMVAILAKVNLNIAEPSEPNLEGAVQCLLCNVFPAYFT